MEAVVGDTFCSWFDKLTTNGRYIEGFNLAGNLFPFVEVSALHKPFTFSQNFTGYRITLVKFFDEIRMRLYIRVNTPG